jgi:hypothetical protein
MHRLTLSDTLPALRKGILGGLSVVALTMFVAQHSAAALFTLVDENSTVDFDTTSSANAYSWSVDGQDQLFQQAFWYRVGNGPEQSLHSLPIGFQLASNTNSDPGLDTLNVVYNGPGYNIEVSYRLDGGIAGSGASDMGEQIAVTNNTGSPLDFHFFQYSDFEILGTAGNDTAVFLNANTVQQSEGVFSLNETVASPAASHREINFYDVTLDKLEDGVASTLNDLPAIGVPLGPGDMTWAFQWDRIIPASGLGRTFIISKDKRLSVVPEPTTVAIFAVAGALLLGFGKGRRRPARPHSGA